MKNVLIIDDHAVVRMGMRMVLFELSPQIEIQEVETFPDAIDIIGSHRLDLIILDINIPGGRETSMIDVIRQLQPESKILVFSGLEEERYALRYIQAGAHGFLPKKLSSTHYKDAINTVIREERYVSSQIQQEILSKVSERRYISNIPIGKGLSDREAEIAMLLIDGKWTKEIALQLDLKESTISTFKKRIFTKTGVKNAIELAALFKDN